MTLIWTIALILEFQAIIWIFRNTIDVAIIALVIVFQPEFRRALEQLGQNSIFSTIMETKDKTERFSDETVHEIIRATFDLAKSKTGALMVIEKDVPLNEYEKSGISIDAEISSQLLINIFEINTPLHDGAVLIRGNRVVSATSYLPLSDDIMLSKDLGTRHRAAVGISEVTDSLTIVVSEETGAISIAETGSLARYLDIKTLKQILMDMYKTEDQMQLFITKWRRRDEQRDKQKQEE